MDTIHYDSGIYIHMHGYVSIIIVYVETNIVYHTPYAVHRSYVGCPDCGIQFKLFELENQWIFYLESIGHPGNVCVDDDMFSAHLNTLFPAKWICLQWNAMNFRLFKMTARWNRHFFEKKKIYKKMDFASKVNSFCAFDTNQICKKEVRRARQ